MLRPALFFRTCYADSITIKLRRKRRNFPFRILCIALIVRLLHGIRLILFLMLSLLQAA